MELKVKRLYVKLSTDPVDKSVGEESECEPSAGSAGQFYSLETK
jgi:hypothetical protein